jgi:hypothetical protein
MKMQTLLAPIESQRAVLTFSGWPDAGEMIRHSLRELKTILSWERAATWDLDGFWHIHAVRPQIHIHHGQIQKMEWPAYHFFLSASPQAGPILLGTGPEPTCNWRLFSADLLQQLSQWGCKEIILLGSLYDQVFHDESIISVVVQDTKSFNRVRELGCQRIQYQGPGAIHSAIMQHAPALGIHCISLWAHLPFYLKGPSELLMTHYLQVLGSLLETELNTDHLMVLWEERLEQIEQLIHQDRELRQILEQLKSHKDDDKLLPGVPAKVVRLDEFLRKRNDAGPDSEV